MSAVVLDNLPFSGKYVKLTIFKYISMDKQELLEHCKSLDPNTPTLNINGHILTAEHIIYQLENGKNELVTNTLVKWFSDLNDEYQKTGVSAGVVQMPPFSKLLESQNEGYITKPSKN